MRYQVICYSKDVAYYEKALARLGHSMDSHSIANKLFGQTSKEEILEHVQRHYDMKPNFMWFIADHAIALLVRDAVLLRIDRKRVKLNLLPLVKAHFYDPDSRVAEAYMTAQSIAQITGHNLPSTMWTEFFKDPDLAKRCKARSLTDTSSGLPMYDFSKCLE